MPGPLRGHDVLLAGSLESFGGRPRVRGKRLVECRLALDALAPPPPTWVMHQERGALSAWFFSSSPFALARSRSAWVERPKTRAGRPGVRAGRSRFRAGRPGVRAGRP